MTRRKHFKTWTCSEADLLDLDAQRARDLVVRCFYEAQRHTFATQKERLGLPADLEALQRSASGAVRAAFQASGGDFGSPTKESLEAAIQVLARKAASWNTPPELIEHHKAQVERILDRLPD